MSAIIIFLMVFVLVYAVAYKKEVETNPVISEFVYGFLSISVVCGIPLVIVSAFLVDIEGLLGSALLGLTTVVVFIVMVWSLTGANKNKGVPEQFARKAGCSIAFLLCYCFSYGDFLEHVAQYTPALFVSNVDDGAILAFLLAYDAILPVVKFIDFFPKLAAPEVASGWQSLLIYSFMLSIQFFLVILVAQLIGYQRRKLLS